MESQKRGSSLRLITALALLSAIGIILGKFLAFNITDFMRFSLENLSIIFSAVAFGPLAGLAVGLVQDIVGCLIRGYALNPIITLASGLIGLISGVIYHHLSKLHKGVRMCLAIATAHLIGSVLIKSLGLAIYYQLPFIATLLWRALNYLIVGSIEAIVMIYLTKSKLLLSEIQKININTKKVSRRNNNDIH